MNNTICIDFDGVISNYSEIGTQITEQPIVGSIEAIRTLINDNYKVVICTARHESHLPLIKDMLKLWGLQDKFLELIEITKIKPNARIYIDDKGFRFTNWDDIVKLFN